MGYCTGLRPFGVSFLYAGWDAHHQFQLYHSDPSGNYFGWKAHCIGSNHGSAEGILKQDYQETMNVDEALRLAIKVLSKTMETTNLTVDKCISISCVCDVTWSYGVYSGICHHYSETR